MEHQTKIIAILNAKGGVAKTTSTANIGITLAAFGKQVLMVDLDPQSSLSETFNIEDANYTTVELFETENPKLSDIKLQKIRRKLYMIPSDIGLAWTELNLNSRISREKILDRFLTLLKGHFDYILLDCPPNVGLITSNAILACDRLVVPTTPDTLALKGMKILHMVLEKASLIKPSVRIDGIFFTRVLKTVKEQGALMEKTRQEYGDTVFDTVIRQNSDISKAPTVNKTVLEYNPSSYGAQDYMALTKEILRREGDTWPESDATAPENTQEIKP